MAIICRSYNLLFIMTPRTACTAIGELLCKQFDGEFLPKEDILDSKGFIRAQKKHTTLSQLFQNNLLTERDAMGLIKFCSVRNPFDSLLSLYIKKRYKYQSLLSDPESWVNRTQHYAKDMKYCKSHSFNTWILKSCYKKAIKRILGFKPSMYNEYTKGVDIVMPYENIDNEFLNVLAKAGIPNKPLIPVVNRTVERSDTDYRLYYSKLSRNLVRFVYYSDLNSYGYSF